jgi:hypothetical protein
MCLEPLVPVCKLPNNQFSLPKAETAADLLKALHAVAQAVAQGLISAYQDYAIARILESQGRMFDEGFEKRLRALAVAMNVSRPNRKDFWRSTGSECAIS